MLIDSHCHLNYFEKQEIPALVAEAEENGVGIIQNVCTKLSEFDAIHATAMQYPNVYASVGMHPNEVSAEPDFTVEDIIACTKREKVIGIGETGLDYYRETTNKHLQKDAFEKHIEAARQSGLPLIIHTRDADRDMCEMLRMEMAKGEFSAVIHCFTGGEELAKTAIKLGFYISVSGIITFKNATELRDVIKQVPMKRLLIETDSPFLAPVPHRSKKNHPAYVSYVAEKLSEIMEISPEKCASITTENFKTLFKVA